MATLAASTAHSHLGEEGGGAVPSGWRGPLATLLQAEPQRERRIEARRAAGEEASRLTHLPVRTTQPLQQRAGLALGLGGEPVGRSEVEDLDGPPVVWRRRTLRYYRPTISKHGGGRELATRGECYTVRRAYGAPGRTDTPRAATAAAEESAVRARGHARSETGRGTRRATGRPQPPAARTRPHTLPCRGRARTGRREIGRSALSPGRAGKGRRPPSRAAPRGSTC